MRFRPLPHADLLRDRLSYDPTSGCLTWRHAPSRHERGNRRWAGVEATHISKRGYLQVRIDGKLYQAQRVIWKMVTGSDPVNEIDHRARNRTNNKWDNLREADRSQQLHNKSYKRRTSQLPRNIYRDPRTHKFQVYVNRGGRRLSRGGLPSLEDALRVRSQLINEMYGPYGVVEQ